ncbi:MAG: cellulose synthase operon protein YhjQ/BcsQ [Anaerolineales bacterium]|jgi:pilus assembly protein CpaE
MAVVGLFGAKGGCGVSLLTTNLGVSLASKEPTLLIDLHPWLGYDDLLLDVSVERSWQDLLPVAGEITQHHLDLTLARHESGLCLLAAPTRWKQEASLTPMAKLWKSLRARFTWLLLDLPVAQTHVAQSAVFIIDVFLLVTTLDPPALRSAKRLSAMLPEEIAKRTAIVLNQVTKKHPTHPASVAVSIGLPLRAVLPLDPRAVGRQVHFGEPCVSDPESRYGKAVNHLAFRLMQGAAESRSVADAGLGKFSVGEVKIEEDQA